MSITEKLNGSPFFAQCHGSRPAQSRTLPSTLERIQDSFSISAPLAPYCPSGSPVEVAGTLTRCLKQQASSKERKCGPGDSTTWVGEWSCSPGLCTLKCSGKGTTTLWLQSPQLYTPQDCSLCLLGSSPGLSFCTQGHLEVKLQPQWREHSGQVMWMKKYRDITECHTLC